MFHYTYVLRCADGNLYIGCTTDLEQRLKRHQSGLVTSTAPRLPIKIIYYEACQNQIKAFQREKYLKSGSGREFLKRRL